MKKPKQKSPPHVWVVEMQQGRVFMPTVGVHLSRFDAGIGIKKWRFENFDDTFRIAKYVRAEQ